MRVCSIPAAPRPSAAAPLAAPSVLIMLQVVGGFVSFLDFFRAAIVSGLVTRARGRAVHLRAYPRRCRSVYYSALSRGECGCEIYLALSVEPGDMYTSAFVHTAASVSSATPRADPRIYRSSCSQSARWSKRAMKLSVAGVCTSFQVAALAIDGGRVPTRTY
jgi:hypothetical protein